MIRLAAALSLLALLLVPAAVRGQDAETPDITTVRPADLVPGDARALAGEANRAYQAKDYEAAARAFIAAIRLDPSDSNSIYNLACCYGLLGHAEPAAAFLEAAYRAGFRDLGHVSGDPDFEPVREDEAFRAVMEKLRGMEEKRKKASGKRMPIAATTMCEYHVVDAEGPREQWNRYPLVVGLHGYGDNAENFAGLFVAREIPQPFVFVAVRAPYAFSAGPRGLGYSWSYDGDTRSDQASADLSEKLVLDVIREVKKDYRIDERKVFLMGFSQGAGMAFRIGVRHPEEFAGIIPIGGWLESGGHSNSRLEKAAKKARFLICHSEDDRMVPFLAAEEAVKTFEEFGIDHQLFTYEGGHSLPKALMERVVGWLDLPKSDVVESEK